MRDWVYSIAVTRDWRLLNHNGSRILARRRCLAACFTAMQQLSEIPQNASCAEASDGRDEHPFVRCTREAPAGSSMIGLVLVTHGRLAVEFRAALEHVVGPQGQIESVTIGPDDDVEERRKDIIEAVRRVDSGDGVAI